MTRGTLGSGIVLAVAFPDQDDAPAAQPARATASVNCDLLREMEHEAWLFAMAKDEAVVSDLDAKSDAMFEAQRQIADRAWYEYDQLAEACAARCGG